LLPPGIIAVGTLLYFKDALAGWLVQIPLYIGPITYHWIDFIIIFLIGSYCTVAAGILTRGKYDLPDPDPTIGKEATEKIFNRVVNMNAVFLQMFSMVVIFIFALEILSGSIFWISVFSVQIFSVIILIALNYSLVRNNFPVVNIYFKNKRKPLRGVILFKVNDDNVKIRDAGKTSFLNKDEVLRWEVVDDRQKNLNVAMVPFIAWLPWLLTLYLFWQNKFLLGLLVAVGFPIVLIIFLILFMPPIRKKATMSDIEKTYQGLSKSSLIAASIGFIAIVIGSFGAWLHNFPVTMIFGVLVTFIAWGILQINRLPKQADEKTV
jgi:hypothetical protein